MRDGANTDTEHDKIEIPGDLKGLCRGAPPVPMRFEIQIIYCRQARAVD